MLELLAADGTDLFTLGEEQEEEGLTVVGRVVADDVLGTLVGVVACCKGFEGLRLLRATFVRVDVNLEGIEGHEQPELDFFGTTAAAATATVAHPCSFDCRSWPGIDLDRCRHYFFNVAHFLMGLEVS
ncbi:unnamed protein product [Sphagnum troendelagicum]